MAAHVREALKRRIFQPSEDWIAKEEGKSEVKFFFISVSFTVSPQLSLGPTDWWIGLSIGKPGEEVRCVSFGAVKHFLLLPLILLKQLTLYSTSLVKRF